MSVGIVTFAVGAVFCIVGWLLTRRFGAAIRHSGIGRAYPMWHSALAFLGGLLILVGALSILVAFMLLFL